MATAKTIKLFKGQMIIIFPEVFVFFFFFLRLVILLVAFCQHAPPLGVPTSSPSDVQYTHSSDKPVLVTVKQWRLVLIGSDVWSATNFALAGSRVLLGPRKWLENGHVIRFVQPWMCAHTHPITVLVEGTASVRSRRITGPIGR
jgi:hypothetical protein